jgi:hypothetical protein
MQPEHDGPHILVVDDDDALLRIHAHARVLVREAGRRLSRSRF